jgi:hypothetical protein
MEQLSNESALMSFIPLLGFISFVIGLILVITFFVMANRLRKIVSRLDDLRTLEFKKPENWKNRKCKKCEWQGDISILWDNFICPDCKTVNQI